MYVCIHTYKHTYIHTYIHTHSHSASPRTAAPVRAVAQVAATQLRNIIYI